MTSSQLPLLDALNKRYATKIFDAERKIPAETWDVLEQSLVLTPSSFGLQLWQFLVIENPEIRAELRGASWGQGQVTDASHLVVFTARTDITEEEITAWMERVSEVQGTPLEALAPLKGAISGFVQTMTPEARHAWNIRQLYIALGQLMTSAAILGIDSCPLEGLDPKSYDRILGLENSGYATAVVCALGYRSAGDKYGNLPKVRFPASKIIRHV